MNLPRLSVENPVAVNLLMWLLILVGLFYWFDLVRELFPNSTPDRISITVPYPGATPEEVEELVTQVIEREIRDLDGVEEVTSQVLEGLTVVELKLDDSADLDKVLAEVRIEVDRIQPDLPDGVEDPEVIEVRPLLPVIDVVVYGDVSEEKLKEVARDVRDDLQDMPEISRVAMSGVRDREIWIEIRADKLEQYQLTPQQIGDAIRSHNIDLPAGQLEGERGNIRLRSLGKEKAARGLEQIPIGGSDVRLADVARVREAHEDKVIKGRFAGKPAASITIFKTPEQDALEIAHLVKDYVAENDEAFGGAIALDYNTDLSIFIEQRLELMARNAGQGLILVLLVLVLFLDFGVAFWVAAGIPIAFLSTFVAMDWLGVTINLITLFGLIIVLGLIVDDAIVIGENVFSKMRQGMKRTEAAVIGTSEMAKPVLVAVLTTVAAFVPLAFMEGRMGAFMGVLPLVVVAALGMSLVEALVILPAHLGHAREGRLAKISPRLASLVRRVEETRHHLLETVLPNALERMLRLVLRWRYVFSATAVSVALVTVGLVLGGVIPFVFFQEVDSELLNVDLEMSTGTPVERTTEVISAVEDQLLAFDETHSVYSVIGMSFNDEGVVSPADPATVAQIWVQLVPADEREAKGMKTSKDILNHLRSWSADLPGVNRLVFAARSGKPVGPAIEIRLIGDDLESLRETAGEVRELLSHYEGVHQILDDLKPGKLEARVRLNDRARALGWRQDAQAMQVRHAIFGYEAQELQDGAEEVTVRVLYPEAYRKDLESLEHLRVAGGGGRTPLSEVIRLETERGYASMTRVNGKRTVTITAEVDEDTANTNDIVSNLEPRLDDLLAGTEGVSYRFEGQRQEQRDSIGSLLISFPIALFVIYSLIAILFRSYLQPAIVMAAIPFSLVGAVLGHLITGYPFTMLSMIGAVALAGIVVNDSLILVDFINRARREGMGTLAAVVAGSRARLRPILLTTITTVAGSAPLLLERSFQAQFLIPMAVSIVYGLAFATIVTLVLVPTLYIMLDDFRGAVRWLFKGPEAEQ